MKNAEKILRSLCVDSSSFFMEFHWIPWGNLIVLAISLTRSRIGKESKTTFFSLKYDSYFESVGIRARFLKLLFCYSSVTAFQGSSNMTPWRRCNSVQVIGASSISHSLGARKRVKLLFPWWFDHSRGILKNECIIVTMDYIVMLYLGTRRSRDVKSYVVCKLNNESAWQRKFRTISDFLFRTMNIEILDEAHYIRCQWKYGYFLFVCVYVCREKNSISYEMRMTID